MAALMTSHPMPEIQAAGQRLLAWLRSVLPTSAQNWNWPELTGAVLIVLMLVCFYQVVSAASQTAQTRHRVDAAQAGAESYCRAMPDARDRASCMAQLGVERSDDGDKP